MDGKSEIGADNHASLPVTPDKRAEKRGSVTKVVAIIVVSFTCGVAMLTELIKHDDGISGELSDILGAAFAPLLFCGLVTYALSVVKAWRTPRIRYRIALLTGCLALYTQCSTFIDTARSNGFPKTTVSTEKDDLRKIETYAAAFEAGIKRGDTSKFQQLFDMDVFIARATRGLSVNESFTSGLKRGVSRNNYVNRLLSELAASLSKGNGRYTLVRVTEGEAEVRVLYRAIGEKGLNYHEWLFGKRRNGDIVIFDLFLFSTGELVSETIRRTSAVLIAESDGNARVDDEIALLTKVETIYQAVARKDYKTAEETFASLSETEQNRKIAMIAYVDAAKHISEDAYLQAMDRFFNLFPNDPSLVLASLDYHIVKKDFDKALTSVDQLDSLVHDPYLEIIKANIYLMKGNPRAAEASVMKARLRGETHRDVYMARLNSLVMQKEFRNAVAVVETLQHRFGVSLEYYTRRAFYREFTDSESFRQFFKIDLNM